MPRFNIGDRVVCEGTRAGNRVGHCAVVIGFTSHEDTGEVLVRVRFDIGDDTLALFPWRLSLEDPSLVGLSPVCIKIRQIEKRWTRFQELKKVSA